MSSENVDADVIVVGGGLAGTRAATKLKAGGASVLLLEARDRLGGRTYARQLGGEAFDFGGQFIGPGQPRMYQLVDDLGLSLFPTSATGRKVIELRGKTAAYAGAIPFVNPLKLLPLHFTLKRVEALARMVPPHAPWNAPRAREFDGLTLEAPRPPSWLMGTDVRNLMNAVARTLLGAEASEVSLLHFLGFVSSSGGLMRLTETRGGFQQDRIVGGAQQVSERLAATLGPEQVSLDTAVHAVRQDSEGVAVDSASTTRRARRVIVAVPLSIAGRIRYEPQLPAARTQIHEQATMGSTVKVLATYSRAFWRLQGYSGEAVGTSGMLSVTFDNTMHNGSVPCLLGLAVGDAARRFSSMPREERREQVLDELARFFGPEAKTPIEYAEMDWGEEEYSGGCPLGNFAPGVLSACGDALRAPVGRIHWAGTETARECIGYMEGALESGDRAADEVLALLRAPDEMIAHLPPHPRPLPRSRGRGDSLC
jgi:monoamine oxidase